MYPESRRGIAWVGIVLAAWLGVMGSFISFVPGSSASWFGVAAALAALGLLAPNWGLRALGAGLAVVLALRVWHGYQDGLRYQEWLREHGPQLKAPK